MYNCIQFFTKSLYKLDCIQYNRLHIQERKGIYMTEKRVLNFSAGPSMLPEPVLEKAAKQMLNYENSGMSVMEMSHRSSSYLDIFEKTKGLLKKVMNIPDDYKIVFIQGGATQQFSMVPLNLLKNGKADYVVTGAFSKKAAAEAKKFGEINIAYDGSENNFKHIPTQDELKLDPEASYVHLCANNTIYGTELKKDLDSPVPVIADMSSDIFSRPIDVSKYICIYGGAQKNLAPSGVTFVIVKNDALGKVSRYIPTMLNYQTHVDSGSMFNTPPVVPIYAALQTLRWIKAEGGVKEMERRAIEKADMLYAEIDRNKMFVGTAAKEDRSRMNICFVMAPEYKDFEADFLKFATERGMVGIKGHRSVGGFRASCYNAMPKESVQALIDCMQEFEKLH